MKKRFLLLCLMSVLLLMVACEKEKSFETGTNPSAGILQSDVSGDCLPKTVSGVFEEGKALIADSNYIDVQVNVTQAGSYLIYTDTVNGINFRATGNFAAAGTNTVRLKGNGTPVNEGISNFTVTYTNTQCLVPVTIQPAGSGSVDAVFTLAGSPNDCLNYVVAGSYVVGVAMTPANTVVININVTTAGAYTITTPASNGMTFSGSGTLAATGAQTITLTATGAPVTAGNTNFPITIGSGSSSCNFAVTVTDVVVPGDYFPTTAGSNWSYQFDGDADDSLLIRAKSGTVTLGGNQYTVLEATFDVIGGFDDFGNYRKSAGDYHTYADMGDYFGLDDPVNIDYIFLKDNVPAGSTWQSGNISGTITDSSGTFPVVLRLAFTIDQKDVSVTINGTDYNNVIVVTEKYEIYDGANWLDLTELLGYYKTYYAKDIGLIKQDYLYEDGNPDPPVYYEQDIRRHQVVP